MGIMDNLKSQATQIAQQGKDRIDQVQTSRRGDALLRQLGATVYADKTGRGTPDSQNRISQLVSTLSAHERDNGLNLDPTSVPKPSPSDRGPTAGPTTTPGTTTPTTTPGTTEPGTAWNSPFGGPDPEARPGAYPGDPIDPGSRPV